MEAATAQQTTPTPADSKKAQVGVFWIAFWLALAMAGSKLYHIPTPPAWTGRAFNLYLKNIAVVTAGDLLFAAAVGLAGWLVIFLLRKRPRGLLIARITLLAIGFICVLYAIVSARIIEQLRTPLTYPLIYLMGDMSNMRSSLTIFMTPRLMSLVI